MTRIYLPATTTLLRQLLDTGAFQPTHAHAVTPGLREWYTEGDEEDLEYVAFTSAAQTSLKMLRDDPLAARRRVVVSADVESQASTPNGLGMSEIPWTQPIPVRHVAAIHIDDAEAEHDVNAAVDALPLAVNGDDDAQFLIDETEDHELSWYDSSELPVLLDELTS